MPEIGTQCVDRSGARRLPAAAADAAPNDIHIRRVVRVDKGHLAPHVVGIRRAGPAAIPAPTSTAAGALVAPGGEVFVPQLVELVHMSIGANAKDVQRRRALGPARIRHVQQAAVNCRVHLAQMPKRGDREKRGHMGRAALQQALQRQAVTVEAGAVLTTASKLRELGVAHV
jgi:hypothetical protein